MRDLTGPTLGRYRVTAKLGEGGMGEVWRATDTRLEREVAIKVLPQAFLEDEDRLARFEREARLLAQLHHPNIASIHGLEESEGVRALVMELVEGPTLAQRLEQGALPLEETLAIARQIAEALEEAHEKGIVQRDLKPQNIKASPGGRVKVLDFGLAKAMGPARAASGAGSASHLAKSPTMTIGATVQGMVLGTAAYMAPEQAKGMAVDKRADIWAFGVVLYEMLVGGSLFASDSVGDTLAAVIRADIDLDELPLETPAAISRLLRRCLERNPRNRLHDIADARIVIVEVVAGKDDEPAPSGIVVDPGVGASAGRWRLAAGAGLLAWLPLGLAGAALWLALPSGETPAPALTQAEIRAPESTGLVSGLAISPDGRGATGQGELWLRDLDGEGDEVRLTEENTGEFNGEVSPDGAWVAFASDVTRNWEVYIRRLDGVGGAIRISSGGGSRPSWRRAGRELYYLDTLGRLVAVPIAAGEPLRPGPPETLFASRLEEAADRQYDVAADGQPFLLNRSLTSDTAPLVVALDWTALLERGTR